MEETQLISAVIFWNELLEFHMISVLFELVQIFFKGKKKKKSTSVSSC